MTQTKKNTKKTKTKIAKATFAGGCFWCMIPPFEKLTGVFEVIPGYTGGKVKNPTYEQVSSGKTGHFEGVRIFYNPKKISYEQLLDVFWLQINPEDSEGQFADRGSEYMTAIFHHDEKQKKAAEFSKKTLEKSGKFKTIATQIKPALSFYPAEEYHWNYHKKNPIQYQIYKKLSGREDFIEKTWSKNKK